MNLSIIIVNYNAKAYIIDCIKSASNFSSVKDFEWIIVDNNSNTSTKNEIQNLFPFVKWIDMNYNAGFARANNAGIKAAKGDVILLLNPDTIVVDDCVNKCLELFLNDKAIACSVQLRNLDNSPQITGNYFMIGGLNQLLPLPYLGKFLRAIAFFFKAKKTNITKANSREKVDWINGAFLMVKKAAIEKAGLLDEDFFLYAEESEWCYRLNKIGQLVVYGDLKITHLQGEIINSEANNYEKGYFNLVDKKGLQLIVSNNLRIRKQYGIGWFLFNVLMYVLEIPIFLICSFIDNLIHFKNPFKSWIDCYKYSKNILILISLSSAIILKKKRLFNVLN
ncbi:MAG: glycosyltransferase family 2 protein [Parafilimonas sp.]